MSDQAPHALYLILLIAFVGSALIGTRIPIGKAARMTLAWLAIFAVAFAIFAYRSELAGIGQRLRAEATGEPIAEGHELRIPMSNDGHFWVEAQVDGHRTRFLVDSGASITTISRDSAQKAGIDGTGMTDTVSTANGVTQVQRAYADRLRLGPIERRNVRIHINDSDDTNVLGMNFLSSLQGWRVEGNYLVLRP